MVVCPWKYFCDFFCKVCLPEPPKHTGLLAISPKNTIPVGGHGTYICEDQSLGVDAVWWIM